MKRKKLQTPHDRFFKTMFSKTAVISSFISTYLFPNTKVDIDYNLSSTIKNDTVDGFLNEFRSDIVYRLFNKTNSHFIYLIFEHKSTPDKKTLVQLKHYLNTIENEIPESEKHEGPILVVIYHDAKQAMKRYILASLLFGITFIWALFDREGQFLHDRLSDNKLSLLSKTVPPKS